MIKLLKIMIALCLSAISLTVSAQRVSLNVKNQPIRQVLVTLQNNFGYSFIVSSTDIDLNRKVSVNFRDVTVTTALKEIFAGQKADFQVEGKNITIHKSSLVQKGTGIASPTRAVEGIVTDANGTPIAGATVSVGGTYRGTTTDKDGRYRIENVSRENTLIFTMMGFEEQRIAVQAWNTLNVKMQEAVEHINEVVVTALGIKREEKSLGYAISQISSESLNTAASNNWLGGLAGKVAGLNIVSSGSGPGSSMRVSLRGDASLDPGKNEVLFVVDGVPINNGMTASEGGSSAYEASSVDMPIDYGNGSSDLNAADIESVTVLKDAAATALYGSRAANGAIIITTKGGLTTRGLGVTVTSGVSFETAGYWPDFQNQYGGGNRNAITQESYYSFYKITAENISKSSDHYAYGPAFNGQMYYQYGGLNSDGTYTKTPWVARDWFKGFFETGVTHTNSVSIEGGNGKGSSGRISFTDSRNTWITPNSGFNRTVVTAALSSQLNKWLNLGARVNYNNKKSDNLPQSGYGRSTIMGALIWSSPHIDYNWYRDYRTIINENNFSRSNQFYANADSPYFQAYEALNSMDRDRVYGNASLHADILPGLSLMLRTGIDMSNEMRTWRKPWGSHSYEHGLFREQMVLSQEINNDFLLKYDQSFSNKLMLSVMAGGNMMYQKYGRTSLTAVSLEIQDVFTLANSVSNLTNSNFRSNKKINSLYGVLEVSWDRFIFLNMSGRNDWSSALYKDFNSYFYPSVSASFLLSEVIDMGRHTEMFKLRLSWANVGNDTNAYSINNYYRNSSFGGGVYLNSEWATANIKPEMTESWEAGLDAKFFKGRLSFDLAVYKSVTTDQILSAPVDPATGFSSALINAGRIENKGIECAVTGRIFRSKNLSWTSILSYGANRNKVVELAEGLSSWVISSVNKAQIEARPGGSLGDIYGTDFERAPQGATITDAHGNTLDVSGQIIHDPATGLPKLTSEYVYLGNSQNKFTVGWNNTFQVGDLKFSIQVDGAFGGKGYSMTHSMNSMTGKLTNSLEGRYDGLLSKGVCYDAVTGTYYANTTVTNSVSAYYDEYYGRNNVSPNIFSTSFVKLREARIEYALPKKLVSQIKFIQGLSVAVHGRNLAMWTKWPQYDPETASLHGSTIVTGLESLSFPMTRSFGGEIKIRF